MSKEPKIEHEYHAHKDRLTIKIHRYSLASKKTRDAILMKLMADLESKPDRLKAGARNCKNWVHRICDRTGLVANNVCVKT